MSPSLISRRPTRIARREIPVARATKEMPPYPIELASVAAQTRRVCSSRHEASARNFTRIAASVVMPEGYRLPAQVATVISLQALTATIESLIHQGAIIAHKDGNYGSYYPRTSEFSDKGVLFLTAKNVSDSGSIDFANVARLAEEKADTLTFGFVEANDVLLSHNATVGRVAVMPELGERALVGTSLTYFRVNPKLLLPVYLAAYFRGRHFQNQLAAVMSHSTRNQVPISAQRKLLVTVPPLDEQAQIATALGCLDNKIELNRRMTRTREQKAAAIYKAWFVDFEPVKAKAAGATSFPIMPKPVFDALPSEFTDSTLGPIPKGWGVRTIADLARYVNGKAFTKHATGTGRLIIRIAELNSGPGGSTKYSDIEIESDFTAYPDDILFSWSGSLGIYRWHRPEAIINQHIFKVLPNGFPKWFVYRALLDALPFFRTVAAGKATTMGHIQRHHLSEVELAVPPQAVVDGASVMEPLFRKVHLSEQESQTLAAIRDALLPKLLSGEIRVGAPERISEEVV